jgi:hypothetical protein
MHGLYSNTIERFLIVDSDVHALYETSTVIASKMLCNIVPMTLLEIDNTNCYEWSLGNPKGYRQSSPYPYLVIKSQDSYQRVGMQTNTPEDKFKNHLDFVRMAYCIVKSAMYTEMELPSSYEAIFSFLESPEIETYKDMGYHGADGGHQDFENGFKQAIFELIYFSRDVEELYDNIMTVFNKSKTSNLRKRKFFENLKRNAKPFFLNTLYTF